MNPKILKFSALLLISALTLSLAGSILPEAVKTKNRAEGAGPLKILTLGDSNGALQEGWVNQLRKIRPNDTIFNISISGNTIGFNNNGRESLNTLSNIEAYMDKAYGKLKKIDFIIIMLGTNDCKSVFKDSLDIVPGNMKRLINEIRNISLKHKNKPQIFIVSPPPFGPDEMLTEKYKGGMDRVTWLNVQLKNIAREKNVYFINTCSILAPVFTSLTTDGVHLNPDGQMMIALIIQENLKYFINGD